MIASQVHHRKDRLAVPYLAALKAIHQQPHDRRRDPVHIAAKRIFVFAEPFALGHFYSSHVHSCAPENTPAL
jgi:hypothetical protein